MSGKASSSQLSVSSSGSGGLSHVYIQHPPLRCNVPGSRGLFYDDGNKLLCSPTSDQVFSWKTAPFDPLVAPTSDLISEGPILSIRYSLDVKIIAIQRTSQEIQFFHRETGQNFCHKCKPESESILGFFWTDCPQCHFVLVKNSGLDLLACDAESKSLRLVKTRKLNVSWYVYTHESRMVLLASGMQCKTFSGFQFSSAGIICLPKFEMIMAKSEANSKPVLAAEDVYIATIYGRIYCLQIDRVAMLLHSYRFYQDAVVQQGSLPIYSSQIAVSVVDNVLLIHQVDAKVVILYDIFADSRAPISAPLPLLFRGLPRSNTSTSRSTAKDSESPEANISDSELNIYGDDWTFMIPDLACYVSNKLLWKINLDLEAISACSSEVPSVLEVLQHRKLEASKAKQLCLAITHNLILERRPVLMIAKAVEVLMVSYSQSLKTGSYLKGIKVEEEMAGDSSYLVAIILEFLHSASSVKKKVKPNINVLAIQLLARNERYAELSLFIINKVLEPSKKVAMQLLESGGQNSQVRKLGLDMLRQLSFHHDYVLQLVQDGYYLEALRYARKHKVVTVRPSLFLEAALASNDSQLLAAVLRFFSDFTPGFKTTSDCHTYNRILYEMNSAVAV